MQETQLANREFVAFDLETTGLHPTTEHIVEIGAVRFDGEGQFLGEFQQLINPRCPIPYAATRVHGIRNEHVQNQPAIAEALPEFVKFLGLPETILMAHNAKFDLGFLNFALARNEMPPPPHWVIDTCGLARRTLGSRRVGLQHLGRALQLQNGEAHRALPDSLLLARVFSRLVSLNRNLVTDADLFAICRPLTFQESHVSTPEPGYELLWDAMTEHAAVEIQYANGYRPGRFRRVSPRVAVQNKHVTYILAYCHLGRCEKTFRLDRIHSVRDAG